MTVNPRFGLALLLMGLSGSAWGQETAASEDYRLRFEYTRWTTGLDGEIQKGSGGATGTLIDADADLGIDDKMTFELKGVLQLTRGKKIRGAWTRIDYSGDVPAARRPFLFENTFYRKGSRVVTRLKGSYFSGDYEFDLFKGSWGYVGGLVGAKVFDVDSVIVAPTDGRRDSGTLRFPIPVVGIAARFYAGRLSFGGDFAGLTIGKRGNMYEGQASVRLHLSDRAAVGVGYRRMHVRAEDDPDMLRFDIKGLQFGLEISL